MIAILVAVKQELRPILRRADAGRIVRQQHFDFHEGTLASQPVALLALGVGKECARIAAEITIQCYRPDLVISAGFGGGLQPQVNEGDIVIGTEILDLYKDEGQEVHFRPAYSSPRLPNFEFDSSELRVHHGKIVTTNELVLRADAKTRIGKATGALAVDMETSAVADVCASRDTDFLAIRSITDSAREDLPEEFNDFFVIGQLRPKRILSALARDPRLLTDLARLGRRAHVSGRNLARFLEIAVAQIRLPALVTRDL